MPVYLHLPWLGTPSVRLENKIKANVEKCFFAVEQRVIFIFRPLLSAIKKDLLPASLLNTLKGKLVKNILLTYNFYIVSDINITKNVKAF